MSETDKHSCVVKLFPDEHPICAFLSDGTKITIKRDGKAAWLEVKPQLIIRLADAKRT